MRESIVSSNLALNARTATLNTGYIRIYSGIRPAGPDTPLGAQVQLAELRLGAPAFGAAANRIATANAITQDAAADAAGIPTFARLLSSDGTTAVIDISVGKTGGAEELLINTTDGTNPYIAMGGTVSISSLTITQPIGT
jgi:hypothetical protein